MIAQDEALSMELWSPILSLCERMGTRDSLGAIEVCVEKLIPEFRARVVVPH
jgi:hypothetical protein